MDLSGFEIELYFVFLRDLEMIRGFKLMFLKVCE